MARPDFTKSLYDQDIREILKKEFPDSIFIDEVNVGDARVDLLDLSAELHGYEIKSDHDNYDRLTNQVKNYNRYLSRVTIVVGCDKLSSIKSVVPDFWGIITVYKCPAGIARCEVIRESNPNPYFDKKYAMTSLWRKELIDILAARYNSSPRSRFAKMRRWKLASVLQKELTQLEAVKVIRQTYLDRIKNGGWR